MAKRKKEKSSAYAMGWPVVPGRLRSFPDGMTAASLTATFVAPTGPRTEAPSDYVSKDPQESKKFATLVTSDADEAP